MFNLKDFIKKGLLDAVGKMADYQIILNAVGWLEKGVLTEEDLAEINMAIESYALTLAEKAAEEQAMREEATQEGEMMPNENIY